ncbi:unnamed protein product [Jaminaea pallidilutea]
MADTSSELEDSTRAKHDRQTSSIVAPKAVFGAGYTRFPRPRRKRAPPTLSHSQETYVEPKRTNAESSASEHDFAASPPISNHRASKTIDDDARTVIELPMSSQSHPSSDPRSPEEGISDCSEYHSVNHHLNPWTDSAADPSTTEAQDVLSLLDSMSAKASCFSYQQHQRGLSESAISYCRSPRRLSVANPDDATSQSSGSSITTSEHEEAADRGLRRSSSATGSLASKLSSSTISSTLRLVELFEKSVANHGATANAPRMNTLEAPQSLESRQASSSVYSAPLATRRMRPRDMMGAKTVESHSGSIASQSSNAGRIAVIPTGMVSPTLAKPVVVDRHERIHSFSPIIESRQTPEDVPSSAPKDMNAGDTTSSLTDRSSSPRLISELTRKRGSPAVETIHRGSVASSLRVQGGDQLFVDTQLVAPPVPREVGSGKSYRRAREEGSLPASPEGAVSMLEDPNAMPRQVGSLWYFDVHTDSLRPQWVKTQALLLDGALALSWLPRGGGRENVLLELQGCHQVHSLPSVDQPSATDDPATEIARTQGLHNIKPFQYVFDDGIERVAVESIRERAQWVARSRDVIAAGPAASDQRSRAASPLACSPRSTGRSLARSQILERDLLDDWAKKTDLAAGKVGDAPLTTEAGASAVSKAATSPPRPEGIMSGAPMLQSPSSASARSAEAHKSSVASQLERIGAIWEGSERQARVDHFESRVVSAVPSLPPKDVFLSADPTAERREVQTVRHELHHTQIGLAASIRPSITDARASSRSASPTKTISALALPSPRRGMSPVRDVQDDRGTGFQGNVVRGRTPTRSAPSAAASALVGEEEIFPGDSASQCIPRSDAATRIDMPEILNTLQRQGASNSPRGLIARHFSPERRSPERSPTKQTPSQTLREDFVHNQSNRLHTVVEEPIATVQRMPSPAFQPSSTSPVSYNRAAAPAQSPQAQAAGSDLDKVLTLISQSQHQRLNSEVQKQLESLQMSVSALGDSSRRQRSRSHSTSSKLLSDLHAKAAVSEVHLTEIKSKIDHLQQAVQEVKATCSADARATLTRSSTEEQLVKISQGIDELRLQARARSVQGSYCSVAPKESRHSRVSERQSDYTTASLADHDERPQLPASQRSIPPSASNERSGRNFPTPSPRSKAVKPNSQYRNAHLERMGQSNMLAQLGTSSAVIGVAAGDVRARSMVNIPPAYESMPSIARQARPQSEILHVRTVPLREDVGQVPADALAGPSALIEELRQLRRRGRGHQDAQQDTVRYLRQLNEWLERDREARNQEFCTLRDTIQKLNKDLFATMQRETERPAANTFQGEDGIVAASTLDVPAQRAALTMPVSPVQDAPNTAPTTSSPLPDVTPVTLLNEAAVDMASGPTAELYVSPEAPKPSSAVHSAEIPAPMPMPVPAFAPGPAPDLTCAAPEQLDSATLMTLPEVNAEPVPRGASPESTSNAMPGDKPAQSANTLDELLAKMDPLLAHFERDLGGPDSASSHHTKHKLFSIAKGVLFEHLHSSSSAGVTTAAPESDTPHADHLSRILKAFMAHDEQGLRDTIKAALLAGAGAVVAEAIHRLLSDHVKERINDTEAQNPAKPPPKPSPSSSASTVTRAGNVKESAEAEIPPQLGAQAIDMSGVEGSIAQVGATTARTAADLEKLTASMQRILEVLEQQRQEDNRLRTEALAEAQAQREADQKERATTVETLEKQATAIITAVTEHINTELRKQEEAQDAKARALDPKMSLQALALAMNETRLEEKARRDRSDKAIAELATQVVKTTTEQHERLLAALAAMSRDVVCTSVENHVQDFRGAIARNFAGSAQAMAAAWTAHAEHVASLPRATILAPPVGEIKPAPAPVKAEPKPKPDPPQQAPAPAPAPAPPPPRPLGPYGIPALPR